MHRVTLNITGTAEHKGKRTLIFLVCVKRGRGAYLLSYLFVHLVASLVSLTAYCQLIYSASGFTYLLQAK